MEQNKRLEFSSVRGKGTREESYGRWNKRRKAGMGELFWCIQKIEQRAWLENEICGKGHQQLISWLSNQGVWPVWSDRHLEMLSWQDCGKYTGRNWDYRQGGQLGEDFKNSGYVRVWIKQWPQKWRER